MHDRHLPAIKPLTGRSVVLSALLGYHPPAWPVSALVRVGALFDIAERTTRVARSRMVADGDLVADNGVYRLSERLVRRQARQEDSASPRSRSWSGDWEMAVVTTPARPQAERVALRRNMVDLRLAELREGVWIRPDNLVRRI
ncbi:MAG: PaaX domain-containing protein, C- domain protein, partial [Actinomycetes bacterium]